MIYWLYSTSDAFREFVQATQSGQSTQLLAVRTGLATLLACCACIIWGNTAIRLLGKYCPDRVDSASARLNELHAHKASTASMGGVLICFAMAIAIAISSNFTSPFALIAIGIVILFAAIGSLDDWMKISGRSRGLRPRQKLFLQIIVALPCAIWFSVSTGATWGDSICTSIDAAISLPSGTTISLWMVLVIVASSNGVNLSDGIDGLSVGCLALAGVGMTMLTYIAGHKELAGYLAVPHVSGAGELAVIVGALTGAVVGFLWFNCYPAKVIMGDAGSLPLGALLGFASVAIREELRWVLLGAVFVAETLSVILQVLWFKNTGHRVLRCSPLHNHFLFRGDHEAKVVVRFWICASCALLATLLSLKLRL